MEASGHGAQFVEQAQIGEAEHETGQGESLEHRAHGGEVVRPGRQRQQPDPGRKPQNGETDSGGNEVEDLVAG
jgi:hypothetical protein